VGIFRAASP